MNLFLVILGYYSGCYGPIIDKMSVGSGYEYLIDMTCHGPHNEIYDHERTFKFRMYFPATHIRPILNKKKLGENL